MSWRAEVLFTQPILMQRGWGGTRLSAVLGKSGNGAGPCGESWELSDRADGQNVIDGGALDGQTLRQAFEKYPAEILGKLAAKKSERFPLLIKFIDAAQ